MQELLSVTIGGGNNDHNLVVKGNHMRLRKKQSSGIDGANFDPIIRCLKIKLSYQQQENVWFHNTA